MDSTKDDEEPKICTVFCSADNSSKTIFDTIAFTSSKKEDQSTLAKVEQNVDNNNKALSSSSLVTNEEVSSLSIFSTSEEEKKQLQDPLSQEEEKQLDEDHGHGDFAVQSLMFEENDKVFVETKDTTVQSSTPLSIANLMDKLSLATDIESESTNDKNRGSSSSLEDSSTLPTANILFADAPDVPFPVGMSSKIDYFQVQDTFSIQERQPPPPLFQTMSQPVVGPKQPLVDAFITPPVYTLIDPIYDVWIPTEKTQKILASLTTAPETVSKEGILTMPGIVHEEDMNDKVAVNMARIFGEGEASRRKILTVDSVTQDDNGLRELIKLGCYRSAINLTKRLLTLYGQGPGKIGHFSKHSPHSLQLWNTRIALLVRIREFNTADAEVEAFKDFENPDMFYEFYPEFNGKGSMVPFHFRLLAAEIPQYIKKINFTLDKLTNILTTVETILSNVTQGLSEDGSPADSPATERREKSIQVWKKREIRVLYSLANAAIFSKDFNGAVHYLLKLTEKDVDHNMQLKSSIGRLYLQFGDINSAQRYFSLAAELSKNSESDRVETLVDSGLLAIGQNSYLDAFNLFSEAFAIQPENYMLTNNMAVCLVYLGKVKDALALMESTVKQNTPQLLQENVILNLSTIYELENSDGSKKNSLLKLISEYKGDGINLNSLKMPNLV